MLVGCEHGLPCDICLQIASNFSNSVHRFGAAIPIGNLWKLQGFHRTESRSLSARMSNNRKRRQINTPEHIDIHLAFRND